LIEWKKVCEVSDDVAQELLELETSSSTIPVYLDEEVFQSLSPKAQRELESLKKLLTGEVLEIVVAD